MSQSTTSLPHANAPVFHTGAPLAEAELVIILNHGRGSTADNILGLAPAITPEEDAGAKIAFLAPQADGNVWYPQPFRQPLASNEPWLTGALATIDRIVDLVRAETPDRKIVVGGFSQGACLSLEYLARGSREISGVAAFSGALIGPSISDRQAIPTLDGRWVFLGCGDRDSYFTIDVAEDSVAALKAAGAETEFRQYPGMGHTIVEDETNAVRAKIASLLP
ncbi:MAG TPA: dienelactone hydrolase family protein [Thermomicrobiales bacterium]|nr:dienelactone hydrolase family protein [Thermomicrobiales bacterium]